MDYAFVAYLMFLPNPKSERLYATFFCKFYRFTFYIKDYDRI